MYVEQISAVFSLRKSLMIYIYVSIIVYPNMHVIVSMVCVTKCTNYDNSDR